MNRGISTNLYDYKKTLQSIISVYDSSITRIYSKIRFTIININILHIISLCLHNKHKVLDIGCGFGLFGCYFATTYPQISYQGIDIDKRRIEMARNAAKKLNLKNISFNSCDVADLSLNEKFDAILIIDLLHHIDDRQKEKLIHLCACHLNENGRLIIKNISTDSTFKLLFT